MDEMEQLLEKLMHWGIDLKGVRARFLNDDALYVDCLQEFSQDTAFEALESAVQDEGYAEAFEHAHTLKGVAGNLGLIPLYDALSDLTECLRAQNYGGIESVYQQMLIEKEHFLRFMQAQEL